MSDTGVKIKFHKNELIEDSTTSKNISLDAICGRCIVFKARENDPVKEILQLKKNSQMAYVCRYKLVRETIYKLVPVSWLPGEEEMRHAAEMSDFDDRNLFTDTDDQSENVHDLSAIITELHLNLTAVCATEANKAQLVSPIKIVNNGIRKVTRNRHQPLSNKKRSSPEAQSKNEDVSPNKRNRPNDMSHRLESPSTRSATFLTPPQSKMNKIKKNLNESFTDSHDEIDERASSTYRIKRDEKQPLRLTLSKEPLRERNANTAQSLCNKTIETVADHVRTRRSILKPQDSARSRCHCHLTL